jgi:hypothetical protein
MSLFQRLSVAKGMNPFRLAPCPKLMAEQALLAPLPPEPEPEPPLPDPLPEPLPPEPVPDEPPEPVPAEPLPPDPLPPEPEPDPLPPDAPDDSPELAAAPAPHPSSVKASPKIMDTTISFFTEWPIVILPENLGSNHAESGHGFPKSGHVLSYGLRG